MRTLALKQHIRTGDGICFVKVLLTEKVDRDLLATTLSEILNAGLADSEHASRATRSVINSICGALNLILNRDESKVGHKLDNVTRRKVASSVCHICLLIEHTDNLFK